jgi:hypothetical protein
MVAVVGEGGGDHGCIWGSGIGICNEGVGISYCSIECVRCCFPCPQMRMTGDVVGVLLPASRKLVLASSFSCKRIE